MVVAAFQLYIPLFNVVGEVARHLIGYAWSFKLTWNGCLCPWFMFIGSQMARQLLWIVMLWNLSLHCCSTLILFLCGSLCRSHFTYGSIFVSANLICTFFQAEDEEDEAGADEEDESKVANGSKGSSGSAQPNKRKRDSEDDANGDNWSGWVWKWLRLVVGGFSSNVLWRALSLLRRFLLLM